MYESYLVWALQLICFKLLIISKSYVRMSCTYLCVCGNTKLVLVPHECLIHVMSVVHNR